MRESFIFFNSYYDAIHELPAEEQGQIYKAIIDYAIASKEPEGLSTVGKMCFKLIKPVLDASVNRYDANVKNGQKGGAPKGNKNASKNEQKQADNQVKNNSQTSEKQPKNNPKTTQIQPKNNPNSSQEQAKNNLNKDMDMEKEYYMEYDKECDMDRGISVCTNEPKYIERTSETTEFANLANDVGVHTPKSTSKKFVKPTVFEVQTYCKERNNSVDAQRFWDFYESKGWKVGNTPMKDWQACVRTWERDDANKSTKQTSEPKQTKDTGSNVFLDVLQGL